MEDFLLHLPDTTEGFMSALPYMPVYVSDLVASTAYMSLEERGGYLTLLFLAWQNGGVPNDKAACSRMVGGLSDEAWATIRRHLVVLDEGTTDERLSHARLEKVREEFESKYKKKCDAAARARKARGGKSEDAPEPLASEPTSSPSSSPNSSPRARTSSEAPLVLTTSSNSNSLFSSLRFDPARGFTGLTAEARAELRKSLPSIDLDHALGKAKLHLIADPEKAQELSETGRLHAWFLHWMIREKPTSGRPADSKPPPESWLKDFKVAEYKRPREALAARSGGKEVVPGVPRPEIKKAPQE